MQFCEITGFVLFKFTFDIHNGIIYFYPESGSSLKRVGKVIFGRGLGSVVGGSGLSFLDARHRSFSSCPRAFVAMDGDARRVRRRGRAIGFIRGLCAWESVRLSGMRARWMRRSRHEGREVAASGFLPASHAFARAHAASDMSGLRRAQGCDIDRHLVRGERPQLVEQPPEFGFRHARAGAAGIDPRR
jgi:hypothetical protein